MRSFTLRLARSGRPHRAYVPYAAIALSAGRASAALVPAHDCLPGGVILYASFAPKCTAPYSVWNRCVTGVTAEDFAVT
jgi:hypothetical protein